MKVLFSCSALLALYHSSTLLVRGAEVDEAHIEPRSDPSTGLCTCQNPALYNVWYRAVHGGSSPDHFYTESASEISSAVGYTFEGDAALLFATQADNTVPLYRLFSSAGNDHFYTTNATEKDQFIESDGYVLERTPGYAYSSQICASVPLYRLFSSGATDHFYTVNSTERDNAAVHLGYTYETIIGYVPQAAGHVPS